MTPAEAAPADAGLAVATALIGRIRENAADLSALDGAIGDGDHGVNMSKGFGLAAESLGGRTVSLSEALQTIGDILFTEIGGAMGPLYGTLFVEMAGACAGAERIDAATVGRMLDAGTEAVIDLGGAKLGDKTLVDALEPARAAFHAATVTGAPLDAALGAMSLAAADGRDATRDLVARIGRASRLGERSRGAVDPGAASCALLLDAFATSLQALLVETP